MLKQWDILTILEQRLSVSYYDGQKYIVTLLPPINICNLK